MKLRKKAEYKVKGTTSTSTTDPKRLQKEAEKPAMEMLNQNQIFKKKSRLETAELTIVLKDMEIQKLKAHIGYLAMIAFIALVVMFIALFT